MNGKPKNWAALCKAVHFADMDAMPSPKARGKLVDKLVLNCLAQYCDADGKGARPGNASIAQQAGVRWAQVHVHIAGLIKAGMIVRDSVGDGFGNASVYRILYNHPAFPDHSPNFREWFIIGGPEGPDSSSKPSGYIPDGSAENPTPNHPVSEANHPVSADKPSGIRPEHILQPSNKTIHPSIPAANDVADGWAALVENVPANMRRAIQLQTAKRRKQFNDLVAQRGAPLIFATITRWLTPGVRPMPVEMLRRNIADAFLDEYSAYIAEAYAETPEGQAAQEKAEQARVDAAAALDSKLAREELAKAEAPGESPEEIAAMLKKLVE